MAGSADVTGLRNVHRDQYGDKKADPPLMRHQALLTLDVVTDQGEAIYVDDNGRVGFIMPAREYDDFGRPLEISISVRPGDHLQGEEPAEI